MPHEVVESLAEWIRSRPLAIDRARLQGMLSTIERGVAHPISLSMFPFDRHDDDRPYILQDRIARLEIRGPLQKRSYFRRSYQGIRDSLEMAVEDSSVDGVLIDLDSPGGGVDGLFELTDWIAEARDRKPIWSIANDFAASAAYAIAAATGRIHLTRTAAVGSVGVIAMHAEYSRMDERIGLTFTPVFAGERKNDFTDTEPLNDTARGLLQAEIDRLYEIFTTAVARYRGMEEPAVRATEAGIFYGEHAISAGFADGVATLGETLEQFRAALDRRKGGKSMSTKDKTTTDGQVPAGAGANANPESSSDAGAEPTAGAGAEVIDLDAARGEGREAGAAAERERAAAINQLCQLAGMPEVAGAMIEEGITPEAAGARLIEEKAKADGQEIRSQHDGKAGGRTIDYRSIYERWNGKASA